MSKKLHICHLFSTFAEGGPQLRMAALMKTFHDSMRHSIVALDRRFDAASRIDSRVDLEIIRPPAGRSILHMQVGLSRLLRSVDPDVVVTYNWGAIQGVLASQLLAIPVVHHEHGFGVDEACKLKQRRVWARNLLLRHAFRTVVPSQTLLNIALNVYRLPKHRVTYIPNGVDTARYCPGSNVAARGALGIHETEFVVGFVGSLRPEKNLDLLLRAFGLAAIPRSRLLLVGEGPCRPELERLGRELNILPQMIFAGATSNTARLFRCFDVFAMSSLTEQTPMALLEAMASGLPVVCTDVGDCAHLLGERRAEQIVRIDDCGKFAERLRVYSSDEAPRRRLGDLNRSRCKECFSEDQMIQQYGNLFWAAAGNKRQLSSYAVTA